MKKPLWEPSVKRIRNANVTRFIEYVGKKRNVRFSGYFDLYQWSVDRIPEFWEDVWDFVGIKASKKYDKVVKDLTTFPGTDWFPGAELNFAENLLRYRDGKTAITSKAETRPSVSITHEDLARQVGRVANALRERGVTKTDRVVGYMPNIDRDGRRYARDHEHRRHLGVVRLRAGDSAQSSTGSVRSRRRFSLRSTAICTRINPSPCCPMSRQSWTPCRP